MPAKPSVHKKIVVRGTGAQLNRYISLLTRYILFMARGSFGVHARVKYGQVDLSVHKWKNRATAWLQNVQQMRLDLNMNA